MRRYYNESRRENPYYDYDWDNDGYPGEFVYGEDAYVDDYYMDERWKPIRGFEREYWVSNLARVYSVKSRSFLKVKPMDDHGHLGVCLYHNGIRYYRYIHRLVAEAFIPNTKKYPIVRHINDNPEFNTIDDIDWGTQRDNIHDAIRNGTAYIPTDIDREKSCARVRLPITAINVITGDVLYFDSQTEAARVLKIPQANIWKVLNGQRRSAGKYIFEYHNGGDIL